MELSVIPCDVSATDSELGLARLTMVAVSASCSVWSGYCVSFAGPPVPVPTWMLAPLGVGTGAVLNCPDAEVLDPGLGYDDVVTLELEGCMVLA